MDSTQLNSYAKVVDNGVKAVDEVKQLHSSGYVYDNIFVLAHDEERTDRIANVANANEIGIKEEGVFDSLANLFRSRGDELRAKITSLGFTNAEADFYEKELDLGKVLIIAKR
ncbi:YflT domain-containing protein [Paenibacillus macquariensis]|uniref:Heat induced stress protein YflT n=1 Tax=Paenibacillus macquariensis TaxID=948756 RepID=A0ABY1K8I2_9BACL|nr:general stress protein [Paenibacillus macquariensis]MEC0093263.1 general stress protein [Paenibacillus macquariensis]OAB27570.1 general stress protein [Paenibacillus macquariensis subsp. macquariensis]SIR40939.1 Heat induced stress protein YflT [Paenibacillus macquariensis]